jgi:hypothetical protein
MTLEVPAVINNESSISNAEQYYQGRRVRRNDAARKAGRFEKQEPVSKFSGYCG